MEMTRKSFIAALLGLPMLAPLLRKIRPTKPTPIPLTISIAEHLPVALKAGDKLSVRFMGSAPAVLCIRTGDIIRTFDRHLPENGIGRLIYIAEDDMEISDIRVASLTPGQLIPIVNFTYQGSANE